ncbi:MAG: LPS export ABC transporter permease LptF [bacterium]
MILHRAFVGEVLRTCGAVGAILLSVFLMARLTGFLRQASEGDIPLDSVLLLLGLKMIAYLDLLAPLALYIAALLVTARWARDNELIVINAAGVGLHRLLRPAMTLCAAVGALTAFCALHLSPLSVEASRSIVQDLRGRAEIAAVTPGVFGEIPGGRGVYFVERRDADGALRGVFLHRSDGAQDRVVVAKSARAGVGDGGDGIGNDDGNNNNNNNGDGGDNGDGNNGDNNNGDGDEAYLVLENGARYRGVAGAGEYGRVDFERYGLRLRPPVGAGRGLPLKATPTRELLRANDAGAIGELHWRLAKVAMLPVLMIFALAFSSVAYRNNRFPGMLPALLVYFAYSNCLGLGVALIRRGDADPHWTLWAVHVAFACVALWLLRRRARNLRLLPGLG